MLTTILGLTAVSLLTCSVTNLLVNSHAKNKALALKAVEGEAAKQQTQTTTAQPAAQVQQQQK